MNLDQAKEKYNALINEEKQYDRHFRNQAISVQERKRTLSGYNLIVSNLNQVANIIHKNGHTMSDNEWLEGFADGKV